MKLQRFFSKITPLSNCLLSSLVIILLSQCQQTTINEIKKDGILTETQTIDKETNKKQGLTTLFYPSGKKFMESNYEKDVLVGEQRLYYEDGTLKEWRHYDNGGIMNGKLQTFYPNGKLKQEGFYANNIPSGEWLNYYENGNLKERVFLEQGNENGAFTEFHPNGKLAAEGTYLNSQEHGILKIYDSTGVLLRQMNCEKGVCKTTWQADTLKKQK